MSVYRTAGQMGKLLMAEETTYGTPGTDFGFFGHLLSARPMFEPNYEAMPPLCSRARGRAYTTTREYGVGLTALFTDEDDLKGKLQHVMDAKPATYFCQMADDEFHGYTGAVATSVKLAVSAIGKAVEMTFDLGAQYLSMSAVRDAWSAEDIHFAPEPLDCTYGIPLTDGGNAVLTLDGTEEVKFKSWDVSIKNNVEPQAGYVDDLALNAGSGALAGVQDIVITLDQPSMSNKWNLRKWNCEEPAELVIPMRAGDEVYELTFTDMYFESGLTEHDASKPYDETIALNARTVQVS